ncbi:MAG: choice-of-anchor Q domain-containing protein [Tahibacter sp.]
MFRSMCFSGREVATDSRLAHSAPELLRLAVALVFVSLAAPGFGASAVVGNLNDAGTGSLREVIASASAGDTISFAPGLSGTVVLASPLLLVKNVTVVGSDGIVLDGNDSVRVLTISAGVQANLRGLVIQHGYASDGGGIFSDGFLALSHSVVRDNHAFDRAGGILINSGSYAIDHSWIADNESVSDGGGLMDLGQTASFITDSSITGNISAGAGGGIRHASGQPLTISRSTIAGNQVAATAAQTGGGIASQDGTLNISYSTISANKAHYAGGIYIFKISQPTTLNLTASLVAGNTAVSDGGGVFVFGGSFNSVNSTLANNVASTSGSGGIGIQNSGGGTASVSLINTTVAFNRSITNGGGIAVISGGLVMKNSPIAANLAATNPDLQGAFTSQAYNLVQSRGTSVGYVAADLANGSLPNLINLTFNGGPTNTVKLNTGSAAINAIPAANCDGITLDQRGYRRPGGNCDIGAYEVEGAAILFASGFE